MLCHASEAVLWDDAGIGSQASPITENKDTLVKTNNNTTRCALILAQEDWRLEYRVLRCAAACFDKVYVLGVGKSARLKLSRFCTGFFHFNGSFDEANQAVAVARINKLCAELSVEYVLPSGAETTRFLSGNGEFLTTPHYPVPPLDLFDTLDDKWRFAGLCSVLGVPHPRTRYFATRTEFAAEAERSNLAYPLVMKPLRMLGGRGVRLLKNYADASRPVEYQPLIIQDYFPGEDYCCFFLCSKGSILMAITYVKTEKGVVFINDLEIERYARRFIEHFGYSGVIGFDVRRSGRGELAFIECNPRFWIRMELPMLFGLNFVDAVSCNAPPNDIPAYISNEISILSSRQLLKAAITPWTLRNKDKALIKYLWRDPLLNVLERTTNAFAARPTFRAPATPDRHVVGRRFACRLSLHRRARDLP